MAAPNNAVVTFCLLINICSSIVIVLLNKWLYTNYGFPNMSLTCIHFLLTTFGLFLCKIGNLFQPKSLPFFQMLPLALTFCGFVVFTNLSLETNTVGTYQLIKTMTTPCIIVIQTNIYSRSFSWKVKATLVRISFFFFFRQIQKNMWIYVTRIGYIIIMSPPYNLEADIQDMCVTLLTCLETKKD